MADAADHATPSGTYLIAAHPRWRNSRMNRRLLAAARALADEPLPQRLDIQDLYASYPDYFIDADAERTRLAAAQRLVLMHPIQWLGMPALQKLWLDEVLTYGWAYGAISTSADPRHAPPAGAPGTALRGKALWLVATTDVEQPVEHLLAPYHQIATQCGMHFLPPLLLQSSGTASREDVEAHVQHFRRRLAEP